MAPGVEDRFLAKGFVVMFFLALSLTLGPFLGGVQEVRSGGSSAMERIPQAQPSPGSFSFAAVGDFSNGSKAIANWKSISLSGANFVLALGDFLYKIPVYNEGISTEQAWCDSFKKNITDVKVIAGNHDTFESNLTSGGGSINKYVQYCPFTLGSSYGSGSVSYGFQYYFDYPSTSALARFILVDPAIWHGNSTSTQAHYFNGSPNQLWVGSVIDDARAKGISWVIVGMHKVCLSTGMATCEIGQDFLTFLINKRVDLVLQGHDHNYQRSKELTCALHGLYVPSCVSNAGPGYVKGAGTVFLVDGTGGAVGSMIMNTNDTQYFATANAATSGYVIYTVTTTSILAQFIVTSGGSFRDSWSISSQPFWPQGSSLTANNIGARTLTLNWTPARAGGGVVAYNIYSNGSLLTTLGNVTSYGATGLVPYTTYMYHVEACDAAANCTTAGPTVTAFAHLTGDANTDCKVDVADMSLVGASFGKSAGMPGFNPAADLNHDGIVDILDLSIVGANFGQSC